MKVLQMMSVFGLWNTEEPDQSEIGTSMADKFSYIFDVKKK